MQNNDVPLAAFLLNRRASPLVASHKGLTPRDLVKPGREGAAMREVLKSAWEAAVERERALRREEREDDDEDEGSPSGARPASRLSVAVSEAMSWVDSKEREEEVERDREARRRVQLGRDSAMNLEVDFELLGLGEGDTVRRLSPSFFILDT